MGEMDEMDEMDEINKVSDVGAWNWRSGWILMGKADFKHHS